MKRIRVSNYVFTKTVTKSTQAKRSLWELDFLFYVILTISYLRACSIVQGWNVIFTQRFRAAPVKQIDISYFNCE